MSVNLGGVVFTVELQQKRVKDQVDAIVASLNNLGAAASRAGQSVQNVGKAPTMSDTGWSKMALRLQQNSAKELAAAQSQWGKDASAALKDRVKGETAAVRQAANERRRIRAQEEAEAAASQRRMQDGMSSLPAVLSTLGSAFGAYKLGELIKDSTVLAGRVDTLGVVLQQVGRNARYSRGELNILEAGVRGLGVTTQAARQSLATMAQNQLDLSQSTKLARVAQDAAAIAGINSSQAMEALIHGIVTLQPRVLRQIGIMVDFEHEEQRFAAASGRTIQSLSSEEKQNVALQAVLKKGINVFGSYEAAMSTVGKQHASLARYQEEASRAFGEQFQGVYSSAIITLTDLLKTYAELPDTAKAASAGAAVGTTSFLGLASAAGIAAGAIRGLRLALGAGALPILAISGLTAAIAGLLAFRSADLENFSRALEKLKDDAGKGAVEVHQLRQATEEITKYSGQAKLSAAQQDSLNDSIATVIDALPAYSSRLRAARGDLSQFLNIVQEARPDALLTDQQQLTTYQNQYNTALERAARLLFDLRKTPTQKYVNDPMAPYVESLNDAKKAVENIVGGGKGFVEGRGLYHIANETADFSEYRKAINATLEAKQKAGALSETLDAQELRRLDQLSKAQTQAARVAGGLQEKIQGERMKLADSANLELVKDFQDYTAQLRTGVMSEQEILRQSTIQWAERSASIKALHEKERREKGLTAGSAEYDKNVADEGKQLDATRESILSQTQAAFSQQATIISANAQLAGYVDERIQKNRGALEAIREETRLTAAGMDSSLAHLSSQIADTVRGNEAAQESFRKMISGDSNSPAATALQQSKERLEILLTSGKLSKDEAQSTREQIGLLEYRISLLRNGLKDRREITFVEQQAAEAQEKTVAKLILLRAQYADAIRTATTKIADSERQLADDRKRLSDERSKALGIEIQTLESVRQEMNRLDQETKRHNDSVQQFIRDQKLANLDRQFPGVGQAVRTVDTFKGHLAEAVDPEQVDELGNGLKAALSDQIDAGSKSLGHLKQQYEDLRREYGMSMLGQYSGRGGAQGQERIAKILEREAELRAEIQRQEQGIGKLRDLQIAAETQFTALSEKRKAAIVEEDKARDKLGETEADLEQTRLEELDTEKEKLDSKTEELKIHKQLSDGEVANYQQRLGLLDSEIAKLKERNGLLGGSSPAASTPSSTTPSTPSPAGTSPTTASTTTTPSTTPERTPTPREQAAQDYSDATTRPFALQNTIEGLDDQIRRAKEQSSTPGMNAAISQLEAARKAASDELSNWKAPAPPAPYRPEASTAAPEAPGAGGGGPVSEAADTMSLITTTVPEAPQAAPEAQADEEDQPHATPFALRQASRQGARAGRQLEYQIRQRQLRQLYHDQQQALADVHRKSASARREQFETRRTQLQDFYDSRRPPSPTPTPDTRDATGAEGQSQDATKSLSDALANLQAVMLQGAQIRSGMLVRTAQSTAKTAKSYQDSTQEGEAAWTAAGL